MEFNGLEVILLIFFNGAVCFFLPRVLTLNWSAKR